MMSLQVIRNAIFLIFLFFPIHSLAADQKSQQVVIDSFASHFAIPEYSKFLAATVQLKTAIKSHCTNPSAADFTHVKDAFTSLVKRWSRIEIIRFGPVRKDNRFERIMYWPDVKSRVSKGVSRLLEDDTADFTSLTTKSVVVQGLPALEYFIYSGIRAKIEDGNPRLCLFASAIAENLHTMSKSILKEWQAEDDFGRWFRSPSESNGLYRHETEVLAEILKSISEHVQIMTDIKIKSSLGQGFTKSKPKRAPFWRSDMTRESLSANIDVVVDLFHSSKIVSLLDPNEQGIENTLRFETQQITSVLDKIKTGDKNWVQALSQKQTYGALSYIRNPIGGVQSIFAEQLPEALGLNLGFNSLDGD